LDVRIWVAIAIRGFGSGVDWSTPANLRSRFFGAQICLATFDWLGFHLN
jgi:hypothetical protein